MTPTLRSGTLGDEELLARINEWAHAVHLERRPDEFKATSQSELAGWFRSLLAQPTVRVWIAEESGVPVGYIVAMIHQSAENPFRPARRWCEIDQLAVDPRRRRRGIAEAMVEVVIADAKSMGVRDIEAQSWSFNEEAHALFRKVGFECKTARFERRAAQS